MDWKNKNNKHNTELGNNKKANNKKLSQNATDSRIPRNGNIQCDDYKFIVLMTQIDWSTQKSAEEEEEKPGVRFDIRMCGRFWLDLCAGCWRSHHREKPVPCSSNHEGPQAYQYSKCLPCSCAKTWCIGTIDYLCMPLPYTSSFSRFRRLHRRGAAVWCAVC